MSSERERIAKILTRPIQPAERNKYYREVSGVVEVDDIIRIKEALLELAKTIDNWREGKLPMYPKEI